MSVKSLKRHFGWLMIDHSASPGIPADVALRIGMNPKDVAEGKVAEFDTVSCCHCGSHTVRVYLHTTRANAPSPDYCKFCDHYICRVCAFERTLPDYVHRTRADPARPASNPVSIILP